MTESEVIKEVRSYLNRRENDGTIIWYERLPVGKIQYFGSWMQLCREGTPDFVAVLCGKQGQLVLLYIECKASNVKAEPRDNFKEKGITQLEWSIKYQAKHKDVKYMIAQSEEDVSKKVRELSLDRVSLIDF